MKPQVRYQKVTEYKYHEVPAALLEKCSEPALPEGRLTNGSIVEYLYVLNKTLADCNSDKDAIRELVKSPGRSEN